MCDGNWQWFIVFGCKGRATLVNVSDGIWRRQKIPRDTPCGNWPAMSPRCVNGLRHTEQGLRKQANVALYFTVLVVYVFDFTRTRSSSCCVFLRVRQGAEKGKTGHCALALAHGIQDGGREGEKASRCDWDPHLTIKCNSRALAEPAADRPTEPLFLVIDQPRLSFP